MEEKFWRKPHPFKESEDSCANVDVAAAAAAAAAAVGALKGPRAVTRPQGGSLKV